MYKVKYENMFKVRQMINNRGNSAANQFILENDFLTIFQSYNSIIAEIDRKAMTIRFFPDWNYSRTTDKHRNIFFEQEGIKELNTTQSVREAIKKGFINNFTVIAVE